MGLSQSFTIVPNDEVRQALKPNLPLLQVTFNKLTSANKQTINAVSVNAKDITQSHVECVGYHEKCVFACEYSGVDYTEFVQCFCPPAFFK